RSSVFGYTTKMAFWSPARLRCQGAPIWLRYRPANSSIRPMCPPPFIRGQKARESHLDYAARLAHVQEAQPPGVHGDVDQFTGRGVQHVRPKRLEERRPARAGEIAKQEGVGRGRRRRGDALAHLAAASFE